MTHGDGHRVTFDPGAPAHPSFPGILGTVRPTGEVLSVEGPGAEKRDGAAFFQSESGEPVTVEFTGALRPRNTLFTGRQVAISVDGRDTLLTPGGHGTKTQRPASGRLGGRAIVPKDGEPPRGANLGAESRLSNESVAFINQRVLGVEDPTPGSGGDAARSDFTQKQTEGDPQEVAPFIPGSDSFLGSSTRAGRDARGLGPISETAVSSAGALLLVAGIAALAWVILS